MSALLRVTAPYFCAGVVPGEVAAPIIRYMLPWTEQAIRDYARKKGWRVEALK